VKIAAWNAIAKPLAKEHAGRRMGSALAIAFRRIFLFALRRIQLSSIHRKLGNVAKALQTFSKTAGRTDADNMRAVLSVWGRHKLR
jgi:hypothetical protein